MLRPCSLRFSRAERRAVGEQPERSGTGLRREFLAACVERCALNLIQPVLEPRSYRRSNVKLCGETDKGMLGTSSTSFTCKGGSSTGTLLTPRPPRPEFLLILGLPSGQVTVSCQGRGAPARGAAFLLLWGSETSLFSACLPSLRGRPPSLPLSRLLFAGLCCLFPLCGD